MMIRNIKLNRAIVSAVVFAVLIASVFTAQGTSNVASAAEKTTKSKVTAQEATIKTEVDFFADLYDGVGTGSVFESVTWERLNYILGYGPFASNNTAPQDQENYPYPGGNFAIVFGGPENASSQATLKYINEVAKAKGVQKVYHFDPKLDGGRDGNTVQLSGGALDIANPDLKAANFKNMWTNTNGYGTKDRLGEGFPTDYTSDDTLLVIYNKTNQVAGAAHPIVAQNLSKARASLTEAEASVYKTAIGNVFDAAGAGGINTYSHIDYYQARINNVSATKTAGVGIADADKAGFPVQTITYPELIHLFESEGDFSILLGGTWCPYTCPTISTAAKAAKANGVNKIYQFDMRLDGASSNRHIRDNNASNSGGFSYLYGDYVNDFLTNLQLEPTDNGALGTPVVYYPHNDTTKATKSQQRIGVPLHFEYNKDNVDEAGQPAPVVSEWIGYAPFKDKLFAYAWFTAPALQTYFEKPDTRIVGQDGTGSGNGAAYGSKIIALGRHVDPDFDNVISESNLADGLNSATMAVPAFADFFAGVTKNRSADTDVWADKPTGNPSDTSEPSETGGCGTGSNPIDPTEEGTILGQNGDIAYDVSNYDIQLHYARPIGNTKAGYRAKATITAKALTRLDTISFDFADLDVRKVTVNGSIATFEQENDDASDTHKLIVTPVTPVTKNANFTVVVDYYSFTDSYQFGAGTTQGFVPSQNSEGATSIGEPNGPLYWFPSNNNTTDRATFDVRLTAPSNLIGVSAGILVDRTLHGTAVTSHWQQTTPTLPYLEFVSFGNYIEFEKTITLTDGTKIPSYSYVDKNLYNLSPVSRSNAYDYADKLQDYVRWGESKFGKYPQESVGFVFENLDDVSYNLETVGRPIYAGIPDKGVFVHELTHQWFGDSVAIKDWKDLWLNEGFAVYLTNVYYAEQTNTVPNNDIQALYASWFAAQNDDDFWGLAPADPKNAYNLFGNGTYGRGSYALAVLRTLIGDKNFFNTLKTWVTTYSGKAATTDDFVAVAERVSGADLGEFSAVWLYGTEKPAAWPSGVIVKTVVDPSDITVDTGSGDKQQSGAGTLVNAAVTTASGKTDLSGTSRTPKFTVNVGGVTLVEGTDYTVTYQNNDKVGKATAVIVGKGKYEGTSLTITYKILPQNVTVKSLKAGAKKLTLKWKKVTGITKYEVRYKLNTSKTWKTVSVAAKSTSKVINKLKKGKKYQVQIRAYANVRDGAGTVKYYSPAWSKVKAIKVK